MRIKSKKTPLMSFNEPKTINSTKQYILSLKTVFNLQVNFLSLIKLDLSLMEQRFCIIIKSIIF